MIAEEQQQQEQMYYAPNENMINRLGTSVLELTDPKDLIYQIKLNLENYEYNVDGELVKDINTPPLLNKEGQRRILGIIRSVVAQNSVMSHVETRSDVENIMEHLSSEIIKHLLVNRKEYRIKSREDAAQILVYILYPCYFTIMRCYKQGEKSFLKGSVSEIIHGDKREKSIGLMKSLFGG